MSVDQIMDEIENLQKELTNIEIDYWLDHVVFSLNWWILVVLLILPWFIWWKYVDRKRIKELLLYGFYVMVVSSTLDDIGIALTQWSYPYQLVQIMDRLNSVDLSILPIMYMTFYQFFPKWKPFLISNIVMAFFAAFISEPIFVWLGIYRLITWRFIYSFPIYFLIAVVGKFIVDKVSQREIKKV